MPRRKSEARRYEDKTHRRIDVQKSGNRISFQRSRKGCKGKIECADKADDWLESKSEAGANPRLSAR